MENDKREHQRTPMKASVKLSYPWSGHVLCYTVDVSDGGIGLQVGEWKIPPVGSIVKVQVQGLPVEAPVLNMEVVRIGKESVGLKFVDVD